MNKLYTSVIIAKWSAACLLSMTLTACDSLPWADDDDQDLTPLALLALGRGGQGGGSSGGSGSGSGSSSPTADDLNRGGNVQIALSITTSSTSSFVAGMPSGPTAGIANGTGAAASFRGPTGIVYCQGAIYISDQDAHTIRKVTLTGGVVSTVLGTADSSGTTDGTGAAARLNSPLGITCDGTNLYWIDNGSARVRKADLATFTSSTLVSSGLSSPAGITHLSNIVYFSDSNRVQSIPDTGGSVTLLAGSTTAGDVDASGATARFSQTSGMCTNGTDLFVADFNNGKVKKITTGGAVTTIATGFTQPTSCNTDGTSTYVVSQNRINKMALAGGTVTSISGNGSVGYVEGSDTTARWRFPWGVTSDGTQLWIGDNDNYAVRTIK